MVARMILMTTYNLGDIPFKEVYLHGIVRDKQGRKFSKSLNNGVDPLEITQKYGTDALRMALVFGSAGGNDTAFDEQKVKGMKHFGNKIWNIARYIFATADVSTLPESMPEPQTDADRDILKKLAVAISETTNHLDKFNLHEAAQGLYQFAWYELADIYIEASKKQMQDEKLTQSTEKILLYTLASLLKLLHPFMPFITEEIWSKLNQKQMLIIAPWPKK